MNISDLISRYRQFLLYGVIGAACASLDFVIYTLIIFGGGSLLIANTAGVVCGIAASFTLNRQFNFKVKDHTARRLTIFFAVGLSGLAISSALIFATVEYAGWNKLYAKAFTVIAVSVFQFVLNKSLTFRNSDQ